MASVDTEIDQATSDPRVRLAMRIGALLEGGSFTGPWGVGDSGTSFGPFQIHLPAHPGVSAAEAQDPSFAVRYMLGAYQAAVSQVSASLWDSDPKHAAALAAYYAEKPQKMYPQGRINAAWAHLQGGLGGVLQGAKETVGSILTAPGRAAGGVAERVAGDVTRAARNIVLEGAFVALGLGLVGLGAWKATSGARQKVANRGAELAGAAAKGAAL